MKPNKRGQEFKVLKLKIKEDAVSPHVIYIKEHSVRDHSMDKPPGRTLIVLNIPPYADKQGLINAFSQVGNIINIIFTLSPGSIDDTKTKKFIEDNEITGFKLAFIIFENVSDLDKALKLKSLQPMSNEIHVINTGMSKWASEYNASIMSTTFMKESIENFMKHHDSKTKMSEKKEKDLAEEDDEGWMTVTKGGKVKSFARSEKIENKILAKEEQGKKRKELKNFYTFQIRESKMKHVVALRQKFEEDKKKINIIKQSRRFKPF